MPLLKSYKELIKINSLEGRLAYLSLPGSVGIETFGAMRWLNQRFYTKDPRWKRVRRKIILRDNGCELGMEGYEIVGSIYIHHINPITPEDLYYDRPIVWDEDNLICSSSYMHRAIHYGSTHLKDVDILPNVRYENDTCPWR